MTEVTNGAIDLAHYGPIGDAARNIASYCDGNARAHVYTAAFAALTTASAEAEGLRKEVERYKPAWEDLFRHLQWMQGHPALPARYLGCSLAWIASDLIASAYPEYREAIRAALGEQGQ